MHYTNGVGGPKPSIARRLLVACAVVVLGAVAAEMAGALFYFWNHGGLVYLRRTPSPGPKPASSERYHLRFHPYFGFTGQYNLPDGQSSTNGAGFLQPGGLQIPYIPSNQQYVVVVFGGSVAARAAVGFEGGTPLVEQLRSMPEFSNRRPVVINMAQGSGKQPQQLLELAYLLAIGQHIDLALNIDGFNEFALGLQNVHDGVSAILPSWRILSALSKELSLAPEAVDYYGAVYRLLAARKSIESHLKIASTERTGISYAWHVLLTARAQMALAAATAEYDAVAKSDPPKIKFRLGADLPPIKGADPIGDIFDLWLKCSQQMRTIAATNGFKYLHIIQPNQYFSGHQFSDRESKIALSLPFNHEYVEGTKRGYLMLSQRLNLLSENGIVSLIGLFDQVDGEVYGDSCCHFTKRGETIFSEAVAKEAAAAIKR